MKDNKKIAIASYWESNTNYGQILQGVALQRVLLDLGYNPFTIRYNMSSNDYSSKSLKQKIYELWHDDVTVFNHIKRRLKHILQKCYSQTNVITPDNSCRLFDAFRKEYLNMSSMKYEGYKSLDSDELKSCKYLIVGSDQVWHKASGPQRRKYLLLEFAKAGQKRISYSASFGRDSIIDNLEEEEYRRELQHFNAISVREDSGIELCRRLGVSSICVSDPTLLLDKHQWMSLLRLNRDNKVKNRVFIYSLKANHPIIDKVLDLIEKLSLDYDYVCSDDNVDDIRSTIKATPKEWIQLISNSSVVITTSYHGTIFSLNFNVPVISIGNSGRLDSGSNRRMYSIMNKVGLLDHFINVFEDNLIKSLLHTAVDWEYVNDIMKAERSKGIRFLEQSLNV